MAEFCKDCSGHTICDFCSHFKPDRPFTVEDGECEDGICGVIGKETSRTSGYACDDFRCFKLTT